MVSKPKRKPARATVITQKLSWLVFMGNENRENVGEMVRVDVFGGIG